MKSTLSIVIATYNRCKPLRNALISAARLDPKPLEILVIDQTVDLPEGELTWRQEHVRMNPEVRFITYSTPNAQSARNIGIQKAAGSVVMFMDDDVEVPPDLVAKHIGNYNDPTIAAISGMILEPGEQPVFDFPKAYFDKNIGFCFFPLNFGQRAETINLSSCNCSVRREYALAIGGFDENYTKTLFDDTDFGWRLYQYCRKRQLKIVHDPEAWLIHLRVPSGGGRPGAKNLHVLGDRDAWFTWCYFHFQHWGYSSFLRLAKRYRWWIWHKKNVLSPWWIMVAHLELVVGVFRAIRKINKGPVLIDDSH